MKRRPRNGIVAFARVAMTTVEWDTWKRVGANRWLKAQLAAAAEHPELHMQGTALLEAQLNGIVKS